MQRLCREVTRCASREGRGVRDSPRRHRRTIQVPRHSRECETRSHIDCARCRAFGVSGPRRIVLSRRGGSRLRRLPATTTRTGREAANSGSEAKRSREESSRHRHRPHRADSGRSDETLSRRSTTAKRVAPSGRNSVDVDSLLFRSAATARLAGDVGAEGCRDYIRRRPEAREAASKVGEERHGTSTVRVPRSGRENHARPIHSHKGAQFFENTGLADGLLASNDGDGAVAPASV